MMTTPADRIKKLEKQEEYEFSKCMEATQNAIKRFNSGYDYQTHIDIECSLGVNDFHNFLKKNCWVVKHDNDWWFKRPNYSQLHVWKIPKNKTNTIYTYSYIPFEFEQAYSSPGSSW